MLGFCLSNILTVYPSNFFVLSLSCLFLLLPEVFFFFSQNLSKNSLLSYADCLLRWLILWHRGIACYCAFKTSFWRSDQPSCTPLPFRNESQRDLPYQCPPEVPGSSFACTPCDFIKNKELYRFMVLLSKTDNTWSYNE